MFFDGGFGDAKNRRNIRVCFALREPKQGFSRAGGKAKFLECFGRGKISFEFALRLLLRTTESRFDGSDQFRVSYRLRQIIVGAEVHAATKIVLLSLGSEKDERNGRQFDILLH